MTAKIAVQKNLRWFSGKRSSDHAALKVDRGFPRNKF